MEKIQEGDGFLYPVSFLPLLELFYLNILGLLFTSCTVTDETDYDSA